MTRKRKSTVDRQSKAPQNGKPPKRARPGTAQAKDSMSIAQARQVKKEIVESGIMESDADEDDVQSKVKKIVKRVKRKGSMKDSADSNEHGQAPVDHYDNYWSMHESDLTEPGATYTYCKRKSK